MCPGQRRQKASRGGYHDLPERGCGSWIRSPETTASSPRRSSTRPHGRGYITDTDVFRQFTHSDVPMACDAYPHQAREINVYICFYTAFLVYHGQMQSNDLLDRLALAVLPARDVANLRGRGGQHHDYRHAESRRSLLESSAYNFPYFKRVMSGAAEA
ncbi:hypothetical protein DL767_008688 [Monosporascus sp. MG133]|nr:hypothetical protein DL767_008688 [Monosporascus sp. MG133]